MERRSLAANTNCVCPAHTDARTCYDLRAYGYSPVRRGPGSYDVMDWIEGEPNLEDDDYECECTCHGHDGYDEDDE